MGVAVALSVVAAARPDLLPPDLLALEDILNVGAISALLSDVAKGKETDGERIAARMETLLPDDDRLEQLAIGQKDLLRILVAQRGWQKQMLRPQEEDAETGARLLAAFATMTGDLALIRDRLAETATQAQMDELLWLIREEVLSLLREDVREHYPDWTPSPPPPREADDLPPLVPHLNLLPPGSRPRYPRNMLFTGREDELRAPAARLLPRDDGRPSAVISSGLGGIGKTQLAIEFAHRYGRFFHGVHWVSMADPGAVAAEIAECGLEMALASNFSALPLDEQVTLTRRVWAGPEARLLIFDNCETHELLRQWRPASGGARLLVTSRSAVWPPEYGAAVLPVAPLPRGASQALLREYLDPVGRAETDEALGEIAAELDGLPLALALAGHYLARYKGDSVDVYLQALRDAEELVPIGRGATSLTDHDLSVRRTFAVSYERLDAADEVDGIARALLARAACFAPGEPLPERLLHETPAGADSHLRVDGLLRLLEQVGAEVYRLHRLLARFVADALAEIMDGARAAVERTIQSLFDRVRKSRDLREFRPVVLHARHVVDSVAVRNPDDPATAASLNNLGTLLKDMGDLAGARPYLERALSIHERVLGPEQPTTAQQAATATDLNNLGQLLHAMGDLTGAKPYLDRALDICDRVLGPDHPDTARGHHSLGLLLQDMGDLAGAREHLERALDICDRVLGPDHPSTAMILNNIAVLCYYEGDLPAAAGYMRRALAAREKALGPDHPHTRSSRVGLAVIEERMTGK